MTERPRRTTRADYVRFVAIDTRWADNDAYGHVNNVVYYSFFDTAVNGILVADGGLDIATSETIGLVVSNACDYFASLTFPDKVEVGVRVVEIGRSSVRYALGVFRAGAMDAAAQGAFTHVYVQRATQKPVAIPGEVRRVLEGLRSP